MMKVAHINLGFTICQGLSFYALSFLISKEICEVNTIFISFLLENVKYLVSCIKDSSGAKFE